MIDDATKVVLLKKIIAKTITEKITDEPQWEDVVWLNMMSAEAQKVRGSRGPTGAMGIRTQTVYQFLALKTFEVLKRLKVKQEFEEKSGTGIEFLQVMSQTEIDAAPFLDKAYEIVDRLMAELPV